MKITVLSLLVSGFLMCQACNNQSNDSVDAAKEINEDKDTVSSSNMPADSTNASSAMPVDEKDADFAVEAANGSMMEVEMGKLAASKASGAKVKEFAAMMVKDHTMAGEELKKIAVANNITLPATLGDDAKKSMEKLNGKSGKDFDKAYMDMMLDDHKKDVSKFEDAAKNCKNTELRSFASSTLPTLQMHLDSAKAITNKK